jgi:transposase
MRKGRRDRGRPACGCEMGQNRLPGWRTSAEQAVHIAQLHAAGLSIAALATRFGHSRTWVYRQLTVAALTPAPSSSSDQPDTTQA